ncbi:MAG: acyl-CoA dehydratase activase-related protein [Paludibacteraceae bacterium]
MLLDNILQANQFEETIETCPGCENHCRVRCYRFRNGNHYYSGNNCERVYANQRAATGKGANMMQEKYHLLFHRQSAGSAGVPSAGGQRNGQTALPTIGIPRALGIYENYPFWHTLFTLCGFRVVLSGASTNRLYEKGIRTIVADNICFPAKLMHGHVMDLIEKQVDRIFYPWVVFEQKEDSQAKNSFNCPIVSGYSDVLSASINPAATAHIPLDAPAISFKEEPLLRQSLHDYLQPFGISRETIDHAITQALQEQQQYLDTLERRALQILHDAEQAGRMVILLAARPYHVDPLIQHRIAEAIADMGVDVITENVATREGQGVYNELNALCQWAYPNRIFKAAYFVGKHAYPRLHMVELTSFGCGPDAFILDEVRQVLRRYEKNLTVLKIDDVNNIGSLRLRVRSLIESTESQATQPTDTQASSPASTAPHCQTDGQSDGRTQERSKTPSFTTKPFLPEDRRRTIIAPYFAEGYTEFIPTILSMAGYHVEPLPMGCQADAEEGLKDANNDICYPATIVIGSLLRALKSGKYDLGNTAVAITQTGGQCRASNYYALIKNALVAAGFAEVPVISVATGASMGNFQPGFEIPWRKIARPTVEAIFYADALAKLYYPAAPREKVPGTARRLYDHYIAAAQPAVMARDYKMLHQLLSSAVADFMAAIDLHKQVPRVGLVGEIYVKYNAFSNLSVVQWLIDRGVEVVPPALTGFFSTSFPNAHINRKHHIKSMHTPLWVMSLGHSLLQRVAKQYDALCMDYPFYRCFDDIFTISRLSEQVIHPAADFGEGWFLPGEICALAESGVEKVVSVQPFGCIANHIISKGIEKRIKHTYPRLSLLFLDFDAGTSAANIYNRLHFLLEN